MRAEAPFVDEPSVELPPSFDASSAPSGAPSGRLVLGPSRATHREADRTSVDDTSGHRVAVEPHVALSPDERLLEADVVAAEQPRLAIGLW